MIPELVITISGIRTNVRSCCSAQTATPRRTFHDKREPRRNGWSGNQ